MPPEGARSVQVHPLTPERWPDLETLFGPNGAYGGCWCMFFRMRRRDFAKSTGPANKAAMEQIVGSGHPPGLLVYLAGEVAGWVSLDRRENYPHVEHSRKLARLDDRPVWSIVCFVVGKQFRRQGLMTEMIRGAEQYARQQGAESLVAYPTEPEAELKGDEGYHGITTAFRKAGFEEVRRVSEKQVVMRKELT